MTQRLGLESDDDDANESNDLIGCSDLIGEKRSLKRKRKGQMTQSMNEFDLDLKIFSGQIVHLTLRKNVLCCDWSFTAQVKETVKCVNLASPEQLDLP